MSRQRIVSRVARLWLVLACGLAPASLVLAQGTIAYYQPSSPLQAWGTELDLDNNGQADVRFYDGSQLFIYFGMNASGVGASQLLVTPQGPYDLGSYLVGLNEGFVIGDSTAPSLMWAPQDAPNLYGQATVLGFYIPESGDRVIPDGYFYGTTAFMGIHFQIGTDWHYGWVRLCGTEWLDFGGTTVLDWAYETRPGVPILAGAVPEPSMWALLVGGGVLMAWFRRKRNEKKG